MRAVGVQAGTQALTEGAAPNVAQQAAAPGIVCHRAIASYAAPPAENNVARVRYQDAQALSTSTNSLSNSSVGG